MHFSQLLPKLKKLLGKKCVSYIPKTCFVAFVTSSLVLKCLPLTVFFKARDMTEIAWRQIDTVGRMAKVWGINTRNCE